MDINAQPQAPPTPNNPLFRTRSFTVQGSPFECPDRYQLISPIGQGAYGIVCSARDLYTGEQVAIKKISAFGDNTVECKRTLREIRLLRHFYHENVIGLKDVYIPNSDGFNFQDIYTVTELMDTDLHQVITNEKLTDEHVQYFAYQILRALKHIHSANVLHRDLKPSNILLNGDCDLKICDFGLARVNPNGTGELTTYVATRWYRPPEILISNGSYTNAVDMWSVGCIISEIINKGPLFPGTDSVQQMRLVTSIIGSPSQEDIEIIESEAARTFLRTELANQQARPWAQVFPSAPPLLRDLLAQMLVFNPNRRITVDEALRHPYLASLYNLDDAPEVTDRFTFEYDNDNVNVDRGTLKRAIWEEAQAYRQHDR